MDHTAPKFRALDRDRARRRLKDDLQLLRYSAQTGYGATLTISAGWSGKRVTKYALSSEFFEIRIAEYDTIKPRQFITATIVGVITQDGDIQIVVTATGMTGSPKVVPVAVLEDDDAPTVAGKVRAALSADADVGHAITGFFIVSGSGASVVLTVKKVRALDSAMNLAFANGTAAGLTEDPTSQSSYVGALQSLFDSNLSHVLVDDRYHKIQYVLEPKRATRVWVLRTAPTGQKKPA